MDKYVTEIRFEPQHFNRKRGCTIPAVWQVWLGPRIVAIGDSRKEVIERAKQDGFHGLLLS